MAPKLLTAATALATITSQLALAAPVAAQWPGYPAQPSYPGQTYPAPSYGAGGSILCESNDGRYRECAVPQGVTDVRVGRQLSSAACVEGQSWGRRGGFGGSSLWVSNGCRAEFLLSYGGYSGGAYPGYPGGAYPGYPGGQGFVGQISCESRGLRERYCRVPTQGRVEIVRLLGGNCQPARDWTFDEQGIRVRNGCRAVFGYGLAGYPGGQYPGGQYPGGPGAQGFAGELSCESRNYRDERCSANTQGRVQLLRLEGGQCIEGRDWSYDASAIYVRNGCRARFGYGYGRQSGDGGGGISTGGIIAGVAIAAGLAALLASRGHRSTTSRGTAQVSANLNLFPAEARNDARLCIDEAARQVGATGGSRVTLDRVDGAFREGNGYRVTAALSALYEGRTQPLTMACTTANGRVAAFDVR